MSIRSSPAPAEAGTDRHSEILRVATHLFAVYGYHGTSVRDIAERCGIQPASLYFHFENKERILFEILDDYLQELLPSLTAVIEHEEDERARLMSMIKTTIRIGLARRQQFVILNNDWSHIKRAPDLHEIVKGTRTCGNLWARVLKSGMANGTLRSDLRAADVQRLVYGAMAAIVDGRNDDLGRSTARSGVTTATVLLDGLSPRWQQGG